MKLKTTLFAATLAAFAAASAAIAAEEQTVDAKTGKAESAQDKKAEVKKPVKKHSHSEERTGMRAPEPAAGMDKQESMRHMDMHDHTKDKH